MLNIVCVKWGNWCAPHGARYVNNLCRAVARNLSREHRFICFTDDPTGLDPEVETRPLPLNLTGWWWKNVYAKPRRDYWRIPLAIPYLLQRPFDKRQGLDEDRAKSWRPIDLRGWYNKIFLFKAGVLEGPTVFFDLDTVILGSLDELLTPDGDFCILRDWYRPRSFNSSIMQFRPEAVSGIWEKFVRQGCPVMKRGDQQFIEMAHPRAVYFQDRVPGQVVSYKLQCQESGVPDYARVVCFHGQPRPHAIQDPRIRLAFDGENWEDPLAVAEEAIRTF